MIELVQAELLVELGNAAAGIDQLLLASEEGVTLRADFHLDILLGRTCLNHITAGAANCSLLIIGIAASNAIPARDVFSLFDLMVVVFLSGYCFLFVTASSFSCKLKGRKRLG